jgi:hypothetical protein
MRPAALVHMSLQVLAAIVMIAAGLLEHVQPDAGLSGHPVLIAGGATGVLSLIAHWIESHRSSFDAGPMTLMAAETMRVYEHPSETLAKLEPVLRKLSAGMPPEVIASLVSAVIGAKP